ncbi:MAG: UDP-N-acetylmuramoyl-L-alanyl-D-glutamate--2,6-diaminopimelate ligase [Chitinophagaceae bacterium]|jgi:UDP-N-acetylmuramoyl-L-alanyl-D-glutamate--2,6-diaminopimelate ligase|nr:UDP-N-acetylmuramoyl-L-alanyl-D-glutamate--2,6-diaminopimelate ligase [Chitinophagaceae bacterium]
MTTSLQHILFGVALREVIGSTNQEIVDIQIDSRLIQAGTAFVAIKGVQVDGHQFITTAIEKGATVIVCETLPATTKEGITYIVVANTQEAVALMAHQFYGQPSTKIKLVGVTGTNGKTTVATLLFKLFSEMGYTCGLVSTVQNQIGDRIIPATHTTPDAIRLNALLAEMVAAGCSHVFMESSSHAIHQHRITGLQFTGAAFTNITHDHLDYHETFEEYVRVKKAFFDHLGPTAFAITNLDDPNGAVMLANTKAKQYSYALHAPATYKGKILENQLTGLVLNVNEKEVHCRLIGTFNAYNFLAVYGIAIQLGEQSEQVLTVLSALTGAEGRFDYIISSENSIGIVDYAHTPDALQNVLETIAKLKKGGETVITVVGCGGDRDKTKRPVMAQVACDLSDKVIFTSDNPRSEDPNQIIKDMELGLSSAAKRKYVNIVDRYEAIKAAVNFSKPGDIILIAGKGHEKYQDIKGVKHDFDDKAILQNIFNSFAK